MTKKEHSFEIVLIGSSAGGLQAATQLFKNLPPDFALPIVFVQHRSKGYAKLLEEVLQDTCRIPVKQADEKETIHEGTIYVAPPDYHLLIERDRTFSLTTDAPVSYSRPSIDVLFESAALVYTNKALAIILTGANHDGTVGITAIHEWGGFTVAQDPANAEFPAMPEAAIRTQHICQILTLIEIEQLLMELPA